MNERFFIYGRLPGAEVFDGAIKHGENGKPVVIGGSRDYDLSEVMAVPRAHLDEARDLVRQIEFSARLPPSSAVGQEDRAIAATIHRDNVVKDGTMRLLAFKKARCKPVGM